MLLTVASPAHLINCHWLILSIIECFSAVSIQMCAQITGTVSSRRATMWSDLNLGRLFLIWLTWKINSTSHICAGACVEFLTVGATKAHRVKFYRENQTSVAWSSPNVDLVAKLKKTSRLTVNQRSHAGKTSPFPPDSRTSRQKQHVHMHNLLAEEVHCGMKWHYNNEEAPRRLLIRFKLEPSKHCDYNCSSKLNIMHISFNTHLCVLIQFTAIVPLVLWQDLREGDLFLSDAGDTDVFVLRHRSDSQHNQLAFHQDARQCWHTILKTEAYLLESIISPSYAASLLPFKYWMVRSLGLKLKMELEYVELRNFESPSAIITPFVNMCSLQLESITAGGWSFHLINKVVRLNIC